MTPTECIRCAAAEKGDGSQWDVFRVIERPGMRLRAWLRCRVCKFEWASSAPDVIERAQAFQQESQS